MINYHDIFYNRIYHVNIYIVDKYPVKYQKFIQKLRQARLDMGLTQVDVGKRLKKPQVYISKIERGERRVDIVELCEFSKLYDKSLDYFV